jgi:hypothetical protein
MNNEVKTESNNIKSFSSISSEEIKKNNNSSTSWSNNDDRKNEGNNDWTSVPRTYDKEESCHKHEKTATNNQWCSTNK